MLRPCPPRRRPWARAALRGVPSSTLVQGGGARIFFLSGVHVVRESVSPGSGVVGWSHGPVWGWPFRAACRPPLLPASGASVGCAEAGCCLICSLYRLKLAVRMPFTEECRPGGVHVRAVGEIASGHTERPAGMAPTQAPWLKRHSDLGLPRHRASLVHIFRRHG